MGARDPHPAPLSRRRFLRALAGATGGALAGSALTGVASAAPAAPRRELVVGALLPELGPGAAGDRYAAGLRRAAEALRSDGVELRLHTEPIGGGAAGLRGRAEQLLERARPDLLLGLLGVEGVQALRPLLAERGVGLLASGSDADALRPEERDPRVVHHGLQRWQAAWALGRWGGARFGGRALVVTTWFDSGFDQLAALRAGLLTGGSSGVEIAVLDAPVAPRPAHELVAELTSDAAPTLVVLLTSGDAGPRFVRAFAHAGLTERLPLLAGAAALPAAALEQLGAAAAGIWSCDAAQAGGSANAVDDPYDRLGFEAGRLLGAAARDPRALATTAAAARPLTLQRVERAGGRWRRTAREVIADACDAQPVIDELATSPRSGWDDPYLL